MAGNIVPVDLHSTFLQKVTNFPDSLYDFDDNTNINTLMRILLGNSGTGQINNIQAAARLGQQNIEFSNLDTILGLILSIKRNSSEIYSFATNPFIDQLLSSQWDEVIYKDASYRERLLAAAEAFQNGANAWSVLTLCEAMTQTKFYVTESWRAPGYGRSGVNSGNEIVLIPILDDVSFFQWNQYKVQTILQVIDKIYPANLTISFGKPVYNLTNVPLSVVTSSGDSQYFYMQPTVTSTNISTPGTTAAGANTRYWLQQNQPVIAPYFAHGQTQEVSIDVTGNIVNVSSSDNVGVPYNSLAIPSIKVTSTLYGAQ